MKIVTACRGGNVRSVAAKLVLQRYFGHEVIAIGLDNTSSETKRFVFDWADRIIVLDWNLYYEFLANLGCNFTYDDKTLVLHVGSDVWGTPFNEDLLLKIIERLNTPDFNDVTDGALLTPDLILSKVRDYKEKIESRRNPQDSHV